MSQTPVSAALAYHDAVRALEKRPWQEVNFFQCFERLSQWAEPDGDNDALADVRADARHVLASHLLYYQRSQDDQKHIWYQVGSEGNGNIDISWRERAEELERQVAILHEALSIVRESDYIDRLLEDQP